MAQARWRFLLHHQALGHTQATSLALLHAEIHTQHSGVWATAWPRLSTARGVDAIRNMQSGLGTDDTRAVEGWMNAGEAAADALCLAMSLRTMNLWRSNAGLGRTNHQCAEHHVQIDSWHARKDRGYVCDREFWREHLFVARHHAMRGFAGWACRSTCQYLGRPPSLLLMCEL